MAIREADIIRAMKSLDISREEAIQMLQDDEDIDHGMAKDFDLTAEQEKTVKEITKGMARKQNTVDAFGKKRTRERKPNENKRWFIDTMRVLFEGLAMNGDIETIEVSNAERSIDLTKDGKHYTITLTEHRPPKEGK